MTTRAPAGENEMLDRMYEAMRRLDPAAPPRLWQAAEAQLYPLIMVDAAMYEVVVTLVGEASVELREQCRSAADLIEIDITDIATRCPSTSAVTELGFDPRIAIDAARAQRWRELTQLDDTAAVPTVGGDR